MFAVKHLYKSYDDNIVLQDINFAVNSGEVIALIGENGAGKTTLLKLVLGQIKPDSGTVDLRHESIGYVPQETPLGTTIQDSFKQGHEAWRIEYALNLVGLDKSVDALVNTLSGGQKTRLALAKVLALDPEPTSLLLDEPTNNLDVEGLEWLADFVRSFRGGILLVSHDRTFINKVATHVIELKNGQLKQYGGNYDFYREQKAIEQQTAHEQYEKSIEEKKRLAKAMTTQREKGQHTHTHMKRSDNDKYQRDFFRNRVTVKFGQQARALEKRLEQIEEVERPETMRNYKVALSGSITHSKLVLQLNQVSKSYDHKTLDNVSLEIRGTDRVHVRGANGSGKTTLLNVAAGLTAPDTGEVKIGADIQVGYFSQDVSGLDYSLTALANLQMTNAKMTNIFREARSLGITENDQKKKPGELSRGQQAKLSFAKLLLGSCHLLIVDEPTNHLDIQTREQIETALQAYKGAMLVACHDKYFLRQIGINRTIDLPERTI